MKEVYIYPGSFCPPTLGHLHIIKKASEIFPEISIVCSSDSEKENIFSEDECKTLWRTYNLPQNVAVKTFSEIKREGHNYSRIILIRGIRNDADFENERKVAMLNRKMFGISKYLYFFSDPDFTNVSSSLVRKLAQDMELEKLHLYLSPLSISALLERTLNVNNIFMVVGKAGSGKSTFLKMLNEVNAQNIHVNTDDFSEELKPLVEKMFPGKNLVDLALNDEEKLLSIIAMPWIDLLKNRLKNVSKHSNIFIEIPYGMQSNKQMYRFVGGKIIYIGCKDERINRLRVCERGTPDLLPFVDRIPGWEETYKIAKQNNLSLQRIDASRSLEELRGEVEKLNALLEKGGKETWKTFLQK